ncbi:hypothetical protein ABH926_000706 [Catenulispora sp. GP43]|uniref:DUF6542 domain-containing protein n=1 Tax=Catenulispora sp. GP43 TaxID=3156263 RepID=UPI0035185780
MNEGASRLAPRPAARVPQTRRDRDALRRERMTAPLDFRSTGPTRPGSRPGSRPRPRPAGQAGAAVGAPTAARAARAAKRRQALTAWGVLLMVAGPTMTAAALDALLTGDAHWLFDLVFVAASFHAATLVRRRDLLAGVIVPPLAYCAGLLTAVQFGVMGAGHGPVGQLASVGALLAVKPRPLFLGTALAAVLIAARWAGMRSAAKR